MGKLSTVVSFVTIHGELEGVHVIYSHSICQNGCKFDGMIKKKKKKFEIVHILLFNWIIYFE